MQGRGLFGIEFDDKLFLEGEVNICSFGHVENLAGEVSLIHVKPLGSNNRLHKLCKILDLGRIAAAFLNGDNVTGLYEQGGRCSLLERRLDNVVYRMGMAASRKEARQLVLHAHFTLNGNKVNIPSILVKAGDVIAVKETSKESVKIKALAEACATAVTPKWIEKDAQNLVAKVVALPARDDIDFEFNEQLIVELYSK